MRKHIPIADLPPELRPQTKSLLHYPPAEDNPHSRACDESYQCETCLGTGIAENGNNCRDCSGSGLISAW